MHLVSIDAEHSNIYQVKLCEDESQVEKKRVRRLKPSKQPDHSVSVSLYSCMKTRSSRAESETAPIVHSP
ncbi:hypothetical protein HCDG_08277 [Histoplasma capsulatum H143]|uniref:Uncharacterized protein n=1 Tax=Ajellomyces capsulatus (strain H143) TaxID=544712 RepID=C6HPZ6_AJECH|nr:hypothetical protein HCDG_08277 [Histoplasma capsulatum H143]